METMPFTDNPFFNDLDEAARFYSMPLTEQEEYEYLQRNRSKAKRTGYRY
ncbi:MAG: hypothetical protein MJZ83_09590 [Bacteroidaceae bacterium]|nr:hypothetical protein [Bacteroidaceae bacterium]